VIREDGKRIAAQLGDAVSGISARRIAAAGFAQKNLLLDTCILGGQGRREAPVELGMMLPIETNRTGLGGGQLYNILFHVFSFPCRD